MDNGKFVKLAERYVKEMEGLPNTRDLFIVWLSKIAGNNKCMIGADGSNNYWEVTYINKAFVKDEFGVDDWDDEINDPNYDQPLHFIIDKYSFVKKEYK